MYMPLKVTVHEIVFVKALKRQVKDALSLCSHQQMATVELGLLSFVQVINPETLVFRTDYKGCEMFRCLLKVVAFVSQVQYY
jgi:hypothetical protein